MPPSSQDRFTVVIPARNEALSIGAIVAACLRQTPHVLVIDGPSVDGTAMAAAKAGARVVSQHLPGKGLAIREAALLVTTEIVVFIDADGSHVVEDIPALVAPILAGEADHVQASRLIGGSSELHGSFNEFFRLAGSAFITACINWRFGTCLSESQNGFRAIRLELLRHLGLRERGTTIEQEMVIKTLRLGARLLEVPSHEHKRLHGSSHIRLRRVWFRYLYSFLKNLLAPRGVGSR
ncbi:MAG: glycosyltransferase family 2 protein [Magnetococcales bacterium]|nr:glycosyltransferase family 2 protein [Magnetococcales bacterium]